MTDGGGFDPKGRGAAGGPIQHIPVLREEAIACLQIERGGLYLDATFGAGGYTEAILADPHARVFALDRDPTAAPRASALIARHGDRLRFAQIPFASMAEAAAAGGIVAFDGIVFDLGVSSMQIDEAERGFSFQQDGPLDMRMSGGTGSSAADLVASASQEDLADILFHYGEERMARRIARALVQDRGATPFTSTAALAKLVARIVPHKPQGPHPATRTFQALRIAVNDELNQLVTALGAAEGLLAPGGRLAVVTFHSLEDRIVKQFFNKRAGRGQPTGRLLPGEPQPQQPSFDVPRGQPIGPSEAEVAANPRARSAKLRFAVRTDGPAQPIDPALRALATLPHRGKQS